MELWEDIYSVKQFFLVPKPHFPFWISVQKYNPKFWTDDTKNPSSIPSYPCTSREFHNEGYTSWANVFYNYLSTETQSSVFGQKLHDQVEDRLKFYESGEAPRKNIDVMKEAIAEFEEKNQEMDGDVSEKKKKKKKKKDKKEKAQAVEQEEEQATLDESTLVENGHDEEGSKKKKKKKEKGEKRKAEEDVEEETAPAAIEEPEEPVKKKKKKKKRTDDE